MKQWFDLVDRSQSPANACPPGPAAAQATVPATAKPLPDALQRSESWLSDALKAWCTEPHAHS